MSKVRTVLGLGLFVLMTTPVSITIAAERLRMRRRSRYKALRLLLSSGVSWGDGMLSFKGKDYPFSVDGLSLVDFGITKASAAARYTI